MENERQRSLSLATKANNIEKWNLSCVEILCGQHTLTRGNPSPQTKSKPTLPSCPQWDETIRNVTNGMTWREGSQKDGNQKHPLETDLVSVSFFQSAAISCPLITLGIFQEWKGNQKLFRIGLNLPINGESGFSFMLGGQGLKGVKWKLLLNSLQIIRQCRSFLEESGVREQKPQ